MCRGTPARRRGCARQRAIRASQRALGVAARELVHRDARQRRSVERRGAHRARERAAGRPARAWRRTSRRRGRCGRSRARCRTRSRSRRGRLCAQSSRPAAEPREAAAQVRGHGVRVGRPHVLLWTGDAVRARPCLAGRQHDVAKLADLREDLVDRDGGIRRSSARAALEVDERTPGRLARGGDDRDVEPDHGRAAGVHPVAVRAVVKAAETARWQPAARAPGVQDERPR